MLKLFQTGKSSKVKSVAVHSDALKQFMKFLGARFDSALTLERRELHLNFVEENAITAIIPVACSKSHAALRKSMRYNARYVANLIIFVGVPDIKYLLMNNLSRRFQNASHGFANVEHVNQRTPGRAVANHPDFADCPSEARQIVQDKIEAHPRRRAI